MKRIRIGNDIRVQTSLHDLNDFDITSIKQLRCYFIPQCDSYTTPNDTYDPMQYNICNCGKPKYNVFPCNIDAPHWFCGYNGFGVNSKRFIHVDNNFLAPARLLAEQNRIEAYFPAKAQYQIGEYKFVIVLTIYQPGWCENNLRTITLDEGVIFALTNDDRDPNHSTTIDLDITYAESIDIPDKLYLYKTLNLGETDEKLTKYDVTIGYSDESTRNLTSDEFSEYVRTTVVNNIGTIRVKNDGQIINDDIYSYVDANVTYSLRKDYNEDPVTKTIRVLSDGKMYKISYHCPSTYLRVEGDDEINPMHSEISSDKQFGSFTVFDKRSTKNLSDIIITADGCVVKEISRDTESIKYGINGPITANDGEIKIDCTLKETPKPVDKEYTYNINYYYDDQQCTIEGPQQIKVLDSKRFLNEKIGSFYVICIGENPDSSNIQLKVTGCNVQNSAGDETSCKYDLYGPITTSNGIIKVDISIKSDIPDQTNVTSIVVPDKVVLQHTSHLNIGDLGYDGTAYNVRINYSDGSHKLVNADEFSKLITVVTGATGNITVAETGMIARLNMFENVDEQVIYQLKENPSIKDTMRIVSSGRMYRINYNYDSNYVTVNGNDSAYVDDTTKTGDALPVATFTVIPTNDEYTMTSLDMEITGASLSNKPDPNTSVTKAEVTIETPITSDKITVTITASQFRP